MSDLEVLRAKALAWAATDPDPTTRAQTEKMVVDGDERALREAFGGRLQFGTAGLRGAIGPGPNQMSRALVRRVATGLCAYLLEAVPDARERGIVIGFDGRHLSREFADDSAAICADHGIRVWVFDEVIPTPELAHAVPWLGACAGIMVTASHNPPADNGYKVYWSDGAQIIPPHDRGISAAIDRLSDYDPSVVGDVEAHRAAGRVTPTPAEMTDQYHRQVQALRVHPGGPLSIVYTAMHGVGTASVVRALRTAGYSDLHLVREQAEPDGDFPTVAFPNPEEPGALDLSYALAARVNADIIVANDPDADRLAVAVPDGQGGWRQLSGNQVGCLLADDLLTNGVSDGRKPMVATTIVSSRLLQRLAAAHGAAYAETLTGFKWVAHAALDHEATGGRFVLGYEEALGYSAGDVARDKDGVSAALLFCDLAAACKAEGETVLDRLTAMYRQYGLHYSVQRSVKMPGSEGAARIQAAMASLRAESPTELGGLAVVRQVDVQTGKARDLATGVESDIDLPRSNVLSWSLADGSQLLARPSGTEPKIKFYGEVREPLAADETLASGEARAAARVQALVEELVTRAGLA